MKAIKQPIDDLRTERNMRANGVLDSPGWGVYTIANVANVANDADDGTELPTLATLATDSGQADQEEAQRELDIF